MAQGYEYQNHFVAVRYRVNGLGVLQSRLISLNETSIDLTNTTMQSNPNRPVNILANYTQTKAQLEFKTTAIGEHFTIKNLLVFTKPIATGYLQ